MKEKGEQLMLDIDMNEEVQKRLDHLQESWDNLRDLSEVRWDLIGLKSSQRETPI